MKVLWNERAPSNLANIDRRFVCGKGETPLYFILTYAYYSD